MSPLRGLRALILGPPGGGKGTLSKRLVRDFDFGHFSAGDRLRQEIAADTKLGKEAAGFINDGFLVPDDVVSRLVLGALSKETCARWLLDGFPRTIGQARELEKVFTVDVVLNLEIPEEEILSRLSGRRVHIASGRSYHVDWNPPLNSGIDDVTGDALVQRPDDTPEAIMTRLDRYNDLTRALIDHYGTRGVLATFAGTKSDEIYPEMHAHVTDVLARRSFDDARVDNFE